MTIRSSRRGLLIRVLVACAVALSGVPATSAAQAGAVDDTLCAVTRPGKPVRLTEALRSGLGRAVVRAENDLTSAELQHLVDDDTTWVDPCAQVFVVDEAAAPAQRASVDQAPAGGVPGDVLDLSSRPGSTRTVYLDFDGATYSGTRWRNGEEIVSPAYSVDSDRTTFSEAERAQVYLAWQVVAEDYAPFDVNVTTRQPTASALARSSASDITYGIPVVITPTNSVGAGCACGGVAYVGVFGNVGANDHQPAWVFTNGSGTGGYNLGQVISHEVGHTLGLGHDGTSRTSYHTGAGGWAPIMGASYDRRASHWSRGEYADASNTEDDVALISKVAPVVADDHADGSLGATRIGIGSATAGMLGSRSDTDAFTFTASGPTTLTVAGPAGLSNVDARVTIVDSLGLTVATADAVADSASDASMAAVWSADLPAAPATYTAIVDGTGNGDPAQAGRYSDYGSIGTYTVTLTADRATPPPTQQPPATPTTTTTTTTNPTATPTPTTTAEVTMAPTGTGTAGTPPTDGRIVFVTTRLPRARVGRTYRAAIRFAGPVDEARVDWRLPRGLRWRALGDRILITGTVTRRATSRFTAELSGGDDSVRMRFRIIAR